MYSSPKPYDARVLASNGTISQKVTADNVTVSNAILNLFSIENFNAALNPSISKTEHSTRDNMLFIHRVMGGSQPMGTIRYDIYVDKDRRKIMTAKPTENFFKFSFVVHARNVDTSVAVEYYAPDYRENGNRAGVINIVDIEDMLSDASVLASTATPLEYGLGRDINGKDYTTDLSEAIAAAIYSAGGKTSATWEVTTPEGIYRIRYTFAILADRMVLRYVITEPDRRRTEFIIQSKSIAKGHTVYGKLDDVERILGLINSVTKEAEVEDVDEDIAVE